jgi:hypothetical protein
VCVNEGPANIGTDGEVLNGNGEIGRIILLERVAEITMEVFGIMRKPFSCLLNL